MSIEISEAAWERAIEKRLAMDTVFIKFTDECRLYRLGDDEYDVRPEEALAAQAEIDREAEVTDDMVRAAYNVHNAASEACGFSTTFERCRGAIEAALKARAQ